MTTYSRRIRDIALRIQRDENLTHQQLVQLREEAGRLASQANHQPAGFDVHTWLRDGGRDNAAAAAANEVDRLVTSRLNKGRHRR